MTWKEIARAAWISLALTVLALVGTKLNLFGLPAATAALSDGIAQRLGLIAYQPFFRDPYVARRGQDRVRVITIDEIAVAKLKKDNGWNGWPPGYLNLAIMIEDLRDRTERAPPQAMLIDLTITGSNLVDDQSQGEFTQLVNTVARTTAAYRKDDYGQVTGWGLVPACSDSPLIKLACMVEWGGVPVILGRSEDVPVIPSKPKDAPLPLKKPEEVPQRRLGAVAVLSPLQMDQAHYPLARLSERGGKPVAGELYPAAAAYAAHCLAEYRLTRRDPCGVPAIMTAAATAHDLYMRSQPGAQTVQTPNAKPLDNQALGRSLARSWSAPLAVVWSSDAPPGQDEIWGRVSRGYKPKCRAAQAFFIRLFEQAVIDRGPARGDRVSCLYNLSIGYDRLVGGYGLDAVRDMPFLLSDRLLVIGTAFRDGPDWVPTPLHGSLPGVYYHAMALDNLLEQGAHYRRADTGPWPGLDDLPPALLTFVLFFIVFQASIRRRAFAETRYPDRKGSLPLGAALVWYSGLIVSVFAATLAVIWVGAGLLNHVFVDWVGILGAAYGAIIVGAKVDFSRDVSDVMEESRVGRLLVGGVRGAARSLRPHAAPAAAQAKPAGKKSPGKKAGRAKPRAPKPPVEKVPS